MINHYFQCLRGLGCCYGKIVTSNDPLLVERMYSTSELQTVGLPREAAVGNLEQWAKADSAMLSGGMYVFKLLLNLGTADNKLCKLLFTGKIMTCTFRCFDMKRINGMWILKNILLNKPKGITWYFY